MLYAIVDGIRDRAMPGSRGICPKCEGDVIARCGEINAWHWAHIRGTDCDSFSDGETDWHRDWKLRFPREWREVVIEDHRADVFSPQGVIELQSSAISPHEIAIREFFYGDMVWVLNARSFRLKIREHGEYITFRWLNPRKTWWTAGKKIFFDLGGRLVEIHRIYGNLPCGGSGKFLSYSAFVARFSRPKSGHALCEGCNRSKPMAHLIKTGMSEYYTMDLDPSTLLCGECYDSRRDNYTPDSPDLFDGFTPVRSVF